MRNFMLKDLDFSDKSLLSLLNELRPKKMQSQQPIQWTPQETSILYDLANKYGQNWKLISSHFFNKKAKECRNHWFETFAKRVPMFKSDKKPHNFKKSQNQSNGLSNNSPGLTKSESTGSNKGSLKSWSNQRKDQRSLRIVMPVLDQSEINAMKSSQAIMKKLINNIKNF